MNHTIQWKIPEDSEVEAGKQFPVEFTGSEFRRVKSAMAKLDLAPEAFIEKADKWSHENYPEMHSKISKKYQAKAVAAGGRVEEMKTKALSEISKQRVLKFAEFVNERGSEQGPSTRLSGPGGLTFG